MLSTACRRAGVLLLLLAVTANSVNAQLKIQAKTPKPSKDGKPNTLIGAAGSAFATALLASGTPAVLWGLVPSKSVGDACDKIVNTGTHTLKAVISGDKGGAWGGGSSQDTLTLVATGGCHAAPDESGTQFVFTSAKLKGRKIAVVCPEKAGSTGCGVWWTGKDVDGIYRARAKGDRRRLLGNEGRRLLDDADDCTHTMAEVGPECAGGTILEGSLACIALGPFAPLCGIGAFGACLGLACGAGAANPSCFPGGARVKLNNGQNVPISALNIGDEVAVLEHNGEVGYDHVYAFGHKDATAHSRFIQLQAGNHSLALSGQHLLPLFASGKTETMRYARAEDVTIGDMIATSAGGTISKHQVTAISTVAGKGLYNPLTLGGTIIIDGVATSVHSEWFLDPLFEKLGLVAWLPAAYQAVLSPARLLFKAVGPEVYTAMYKALDARLGGVAAFGTKHGGNIATSSAVLLSAAVVLGSTKAWKCCSLAKF